MHLPELASDCANRLIPNQIACGIGMQARVFREHTFVRTFAKSCMEHLHHSYHSVLNAIDDTVLMSCRLLYLTQLPCARVVSHAVIVTTRPCKEQSRPCKNRTSDLKASHIQSSLTRLIKCPCGLSASQVMYHNFCPTLICSRRL